MIVIALPDPTAAVEKVEEVIPEASRVTFAPSPANTPTNVGVNVAAVFPSYTLVEVIVMVNGFAVMSAANVGCVKE